MPVKPDVPFVLRKVAIRNAGIFLEDDFAVGKQEVSDLGEIVGVHQVGSGFEQAHAVALLLAELHEIRVDLDRPVRQVSREIVERLLPPGRPGEPDPDAWGRAFSFENELALAIERDWTTKSIVQPARARKHKGIAACR
jgi:hypothetical protein